MKLKFDQQILPNYLQAYKESKKTNYDGRPGGKDNTTCPTISWGRHNNTDDS